MLYLSNAADRCRVRSQVSKENLMTQEVSP